MASIASVANGSSVAGKDGLYVTMQLAAPANGPLTVYASSEPGEVGPAMNAALDAASTTSYHVRIISPGWDPAQIAGTAIPVWLTAEDNDGASDQAALFLKKGTDYSDAKEVVLKLRDIIRANLPLINWRISPLSTLNGPNAIKTVTAGGHQQVPEGRPAIDLRIMQHPEGQWELPLTRLKEPTVSVSVFAYHHNEMSWWDLIVEATSAVRDVLASVPYERIKLDSGIELALCLVGNAEYYEGRMGESLWATTGQLSWSCNYGLGYPGRLGD